MSTKRFVVLLLGIATILALFVTLAPKFDPNPSHVRLSCPPVESDTGCVLYVKAPIGVGRVNFFWGVYRDVSQNPSIGVSDVIAGLKYSSRDYAYGFAQYTEQDPKYWRHDGEFADSVGLVALEDSFDRTNVLAVAEVRRQQRHAQFLSGGSKGPPVFLPSISADDMIDKIAYAIALCQILKNLKR